MIAKNRSRKSQVPSAKEDIRKRHDVIRQTQMEYYEKKEKLTQSRLLQEFKKKGYAPSIATLNKVQEVKLQFCQEYCRIYIFKTH